MQNYKHKITSVIISTAATYFGFQALDLALDIYQVHTYFILSWYVFAFHVFWLVFVFDLHYKTAGNLAHARVDFAGARVFIEAFKARVRHLYRWDYAGKYLNYLILPAVMYWSVVVLMFLNPFHELFKDGLIIVSTAAMSVAYWYFKDSFSKHMEIVQTGLKVLGLVKLFAAYLAFSAITAVGWYYGWSVVWVMPLVLLATWLLVYQATYQHRYYLQSGIGGYVALIAVLVTLVFSVVYLKWNQNYYSAGLISAVVYTACWEIFHKHLDKALTRRMFWEYVLMLVVLISFILSTHDFQGRI